MKFKQITDLDLATKIVLIRTDMNVPLQNGEISDDTRIRAGIKTIEYALERGAKVIVATHLGRPVEGEVNAEAKVLPIAERLGKLLKLSVPVISNWQQQSIDFSSTSIVMLENVRCNVGEKSNSSVLGQQYARLCDVFCYDAFATAHRAEASTNAIGKYVPEVCAGLLMTAELNALTQVLATPRKPIVAVVGGSKVSSKLTILNNLADKVDTLIVGGGILNTFLLASGVNIASSLAEPELVGEAKAVVAKMIARQATVPLPSDVVVANQFSAVANAVTKPVGQLENGEMILDIGSDFAKQLATILLNAGTIIWNGPLGVFEFEQFANGTKIIAEAIAKSKAYSLAGGGDTIAAINKFGVFKAISYVSTAGGALLEFLEGKQLPALKLLSSNA